MAALSTTKWLQRPMPTSLDPLKIDLDQVDISPPNKSADGSMSFSTILYNENDLSAMLEGTVASTVIKSEFGGKLSFYIELPTKTTRFLWALEKLISECQPKVVKDRTLRTITRNGNQMAIKLATNNVGLWAFETDIPRLMPSRCDMIKLGAKVQVSGKFGVYYGNDGMYGLFFKIFWLGGYNAIGEDYDDDVTEIDEDMIRALDSVESLNDKRPTRGRLNGTRNGAVKKTVPKKRTTAEVVETD